jgi:hypothetical protein
MERIVACPLQQWLHESLTMLRYKHIASIVQSLFLVYLTMLKLAKNTCNVEC